MAENLPLGKEQATQIILEAVKKEKPETTQQLVKLVQKKTALSTEEITRLLIQLESEDMLHFTKKEPALPPTFQAYLSSKKTVWYWVTIGLAWATTVAVFGIQENAFPAVYVRYALSIVSVLFLPGYAVIKTLYPFEVPVKIDNEYSDTIERVALSLGMSIALVPIVALLLNFTPWGIRLVPLGLSLLAFTVVFATAAVFREYQLRAKFENEESPIS